MRTATITYSEQNWQDADRRQASVIVLSTAELADCTCPDWCERDHYRD